MSLSNPLSLAEAQMPRAQGTKADSTCKHCGSPFTAPGSESEFCCAGCGYVHGLISGGGFTKYYELRDRATAPIGNSVFQPRDFEWLSAATGRAEESAGVGAADLEVEVQGISCIGCVWLLERLFSRSKGAMQCDVNSARGTMLWRWTPGAFDAIALARELQSFGYLVGPMSAEKSGRGESAELKTRIGLCGAFAMNTMLFTLPSYLGLERTDQFYGVFELLCLLFASLSMVVGGTYFMKRAWACLRAGMVAIDIPIAGGLAVAFIGSIYGWVFGEHGLVYFDFVAIFAFLMLVGRWTQEAAIERNRRQLLSQSRSPAAVLGESGGRLQPEELVAGVSFSVSPGSVVPVNSSLKSLSGTFTLEWISGESEPRTFRAGETVPAGAVSAGTTALSLTALEPWKGSLMERLHDNRGDRAHRNLKAERLIRGYLVVVLTLATAGGVAWWWATGDILRAFPIVVAMLVVSCPCAIGIAFPLAEELAVAAARQGGVFVRERSLWARLLAVRKIIFDKTGTLTLEVPEVGNPSVLGELPESDRRRLWELVAMNPHPAARAVQEGLVLAGFAGPAVPDAQVEEVVGKGVSIARRDGTWSLGAAGWHAGSAGGADLVFARDDRVLATFVLCEAARSDAKREIQALKGEGYRTSILSGDRVEKVRDLAAQLGIAAEDAHGGMKPEQKEAWVRALDQGDTLMLGDGANDSLAFDAASCRGTPAIHRGMLGHKADFYYLGRGLSGVRALIRVAHRRRITLTAVFVFAVCYNALAISAALAGFINPLVAAVAMPASSLISIALTVAGFRAALPRARFSGGL